MKAAIIAAAAGALALAGCQPPSEPANTATANEAAAEDNAIGNFVAENIQAEVLAMPDRQRNIVFIRALMDAKLSCDSVSSSDRLPDQDGQPLWRANCKNGQAHIVTVTPDGIAKIVSRSGR